MNRQERQSVEIIAAVLEGRVSHALGLAFEHVDEFGNDALVVRLLSKAARQREDAKLSAELGAFLERLQEQFSNRTTKDPA